MSRHHLVARIVAFALVAMTAGVGAAVTAAPQAAAAAGDPFPSGPGLVFVAQGPARGDPTTLFEAVQSAGNISFVRQGTGPAVGYNAIGFHDADMFLYGSGASPGLPVVTIGALLFGSGSALWSLRGGDRAVLDSTHARALDLSDPRQKTLDNS